MKLILGSQSPRRKESLSNAGYNFEVRVSNVDENVISIFPEDKVKNIAKKKCDALFATSNEDEVILCADTIVVVDFNILEKPKDKDDARKMIETLQGRTHTVYTAVCIKSHENEESFIESTKVSVSPMSEQEIEDYINTDEPYDKAGGYAIQGIFSKYITKVQGDYYNVMGLPIAKVNQVLKKFLGNENTEETKKLCPVCGKENDINEKFCPACGVNLEEKYNNFYQIPSQINEVKDKKNNLSQVSMALGIISLVGNFICMMCPFFIFGLIAVILGIISIKKGDKIYSIVGIVTGILGFIIGLLIFIYIIILYTSEPYFIFLFNLI